MTATQGSGWPATIMDLDHGHEDETERALGGEMTDAYALVPRFHAFLRRAVPRNTEILIASKGDPALVQVPGRRGRHFPQRGDGVYAGYYPETSAAAIEHLETLRDNGAEFIAFPGPALWWLEHYEEFGRHLESRYRLIARGDASGALYALFTPGQRQQSANAGAKRGAASPPAPRVERDPAPPTRRATPARHPLTDLVDDQYAADVRALFNARHYIAQAGAAAGEGDDALAHYLREGYLRGFSPHPLFDVPWYLRRHSDVAALGMNPLVHFAQFAAERQLDPNPYFDTAYYLEQAGGPAGLREIPVVHYLRRAATNQSYHPNPLFRDGFYLRTYSDLEEGQTPLEHFLQVGWREGRFVSDVHREMNEKLVKSSQSGLVRGKWMSGSVLIFAGNHPGPGAADAVALADDLASRLHINSPVVAITRADVVDRLPSAARLLVLEDFQLAAQVKRASARRLLTKALIGCDPLFAVSEVPDVLEVLAEHNVGTYFLLPAGERAPSREQLAQAVAHATRVIAPSSDAFARAATELGAFPSNVALRAPKADGYAERLLELGERDFGLGPSLQGLSRPSSGAEGRPTIIIPCSDWSVSGVNASLEALGHELTRRGWRAEILFTRDPGWIRDSAHGGEHLPSLPYRFLKRRRAGIEGLWEALIAELETSAPALILTSYDFLANGVISALTDRVGVVMWVQADDGDYYEQAYRLGRYCDAIVCVSQTIRDKIVALNPALGDRAHVIPNSSIPECDIAPRRAQSSQQLRLVYAGRLVQYQKRVLDYVELARALDATSVPYEIALIGSFPQHGDMRDQFHEAAAEHLSSGRIRLAGRLSRPEILAELDAADIFVLLSEFEGLPLALVEAMARGCVPVAAAMESGIPEIVSDGTNGLIVGGRDYDAWAAQIVELFRDGGRLAKMSDQARSTVRERFTVEQAANRFEEIFDRVGSDAAAGAERRPAALHWGHDRSWTGDVLPPPSIVRPDAVSLGGLRRWR